MATLKKTVVTNPAATNIVSSLETLRGEAALVGKKSYGADKAYAQMLVDTLGANFWRKDSPKFAEWQAERKLYDAALKAVEHPNPSQAHSRLLKHADAICNPKAPRENDTASLRRRTVEDCTAVYKAFKREEKKSGLTKDEETIFLGLCKFMQDSLKMDLALIQ
jgi:hypothetical protein